MYFPFILVAWLLLLFGFGSVCAINKKLCVVYNHVHNPQEILRKSFLVANSSDFEDLGTDDFIHKDWNQITATINLEKGEVPEFTKFTQLNSTPNAVVILVAEITAAESTGIRQNRFPNIDPNRWFRAFASTPEKLYDLNSMEITYKIQLTVYDRVVFFVPVDAVNEKIESERKYGVATFLERERAFTPNIYGREIKHNNNKVVNASEGFNFAEHCKPDQMIALKYDNGNTGTPDFEGDWEYYILGTKNWRSVVRDVVSRIAANGLVTHRIERCILPKIIRKGC